MTVKDFDKFMTMNYNKLLCDAEKLTQHYDYSADIVNDTYLKMRRRIEVSGFTGTTYGYLWVSIFNEWKVLNNRKKIRQFVELPLYDDSDANANGNTVTGRRTYSDRERAEQVLLAQDAQDKLDEEYYLDIEFIVRNLFAWVESNYDAKQAYLFKAYFLGSNDGMNYKELSKVTGYSQSLISNTIKPMKKRLREEFSDYLKSRL